MANEHDKPESVRPGSPKKLQPREKRVTVARCLAQNNRHVPWIRLRGRWLDQAGFDIAKQVRIRVMFGCLVLTLD